MNYFALGLSTFFLIAVLLKENFLWTREYVKPAVRDSAMQLGL